MLPRAAISWSGGKDCCQALFRASAAFDVVVMVTMFDDAGARSRSHGLRPEVLDAQAERLGLPRLSGRCSWESYTDEYVQVLGRARALGVTHVIFGDIMFDAHRAWNEDVCLRSGLTPVLPIWGESTAALAREFVAAGGIARLITVRSPLDASWLGRTMTNDAIVALEDLGADPCGENGEFHTVVTNCPGFSRPLELVSTEVVQRADCWALDVHVSDEPKPPASES